MTHQNEACIFSKKENDTFLAWLVEVLAPVIMGSKPAEIISLPVNDKELSDKLVKIETSIGKCPRLAFRIFKYKDTSIKVFFYNPAAANHHLSDCRNITFLRKLGYPAAYNLSEYIDFLVKKIEAGVIPDEIGVFLGYPLKDIIGFMGHPSLKLTKVNGWRVYGDPTLSDKRLGEFLKAKTEIRMLLKNLTPESVLLSVS